MSKDISRKQIEDKLREIDREFDTTATAAMPAVVIAGSVIAATAVGLSFLAGQRRSKKQTTVVEIRRS